MEVCGFKEAGGMKEKSWSDNNMIYWFFLTFGDFWRSKSLTCESENLITEANQKYWLPEWYNQIEILYLGTWKMAVAISIFLAPVWWQR